MPPARPRKRPCAMPCAWRRTSTSMGSRRDLARSGYRGCERCRLWRPCPPCGCLLYTSDAADDM
eukprot:3735337-Alexandrium_andersonii.AAC.1